MKTKDILIKNIPIIDQSEVADDFWKTRACGVTALKMLINFKDPSNPASLDDLVKEGLKIGAYTESVGWKHFGLVSLARNHSLDLDYQKKFYTTPEEKNEGLEKIEDFIKEKKPIIVSVFRKFEPSEYSHLLIVRGFRQLGNKVIGYHIQDPDHNFRGNQYLVTKEEFLKGWRGGMLWIS